jgi:hypothetical protein
LEGFSHGKDCVLLVLGRIQSWKGLADTYITVTGKWIKKNEIYKNLDLCCLTSSTMNQGFHYTQCKAQCGARMNQGLHYTHGRKQKISIA